MPVPSWVTRPSANACSMKRTVDDSCPAFPPHSANGTDFFPSRPRSSSSNWAPSGRGLQEKLIKSLKHDNRVPVIGCWSFRRGAAQQRVASYRNLVNGAISPDGFHLAYRLCRFVSERHGSCSYACRFVGRCGLVHCSICSPCRYGSSQQRSHYQPPTIKQRAFSGPAFRANAAPSSANTTQAPRMRPF